MEVLPVKSALPESIQILIDSIRQEREKGKIQADKAAGEIRRDMYWHIGEHIKTHVLDHANRAEYGDYLFDTLSEELNVNRRILYQCVQFFEEYPQIVNLSSQLTWTHYRTLLTVPDNELRREYEERIVTDDLSVADLKSVIRADQGLPEPTEKPPILTEHRELPYTYKLKQIQNQLMIALGFNMFIKSPFQAIEPDTIIRSEKDGQEYQFKEEWLTAPRYVYKAYVLEVLDGDTLWVNIDLGFSAFTTQKLRLRGINTKEIQTESGIQAKDYILSKLQNCKFIAVKTYHRDKFTRYLADIIYNEKDMDFIHLTQHGHFLNQELLDNKLAVKY